MFPIDVWITYTIACLVIIVSPGPDNLLAIGRGLSQGKIAAIVSGFSSGIGAFCHVLTATFGLTLLIQTSTIAFYVVKIIGAGYLIWLGIKVLKSKSLFSFEPTKKQSYKNIFVTGFLSAALNPKPGMFILAFIPQFVNPDLGSVTTQMLVYGFWFVFLAACTFSLMGVFASNIANWIKNKPRTLTGLNWGAGLTFIASGAAIAMMKQRV